MSLDLVVKGGAVLDGLGGPPVEADVAVAGGRIVGIGRVEAEAAHELDATGCFVSPGFVDIHSHSDYTLLVDPRAVSAIRQGVTTEVIGNCGFGCGPIRDRALAAASIYGFDGSIPLEWDSLGGYLERLSAARPAINVLTLVPNAQLRQTVLGLADRPADPAELARMAALLREGLSEGAFGYSTGLEYPAERGAPEDELVALCRELRPMDGLYATHTRDRDHGALAAIEEGIRTAMRAEVRLQLSHLLPRIVEGGIAQRSLELVDEARAKGLDVAFDMHTRSFGFTYLDTLIPAWAQEDGKPGIARHLASRESRARIRRAPSIVAGGGFERVELASCPPFPEWQGRSIGELARERGIDAHDLALDILQAGIGLEERAMVVIRCYQPDDQARTFAHALCMPGSDATTMAPDGPLADHVFHGAYGWAAWFWSFMVEARHLLSPGEAVHRLTALPAARIGLSDRGRIAQGLCADLAVFRPELFRAEATLETPNRLATGMRHVVVNGTVTLLDGALTGDRAGQVIRRRGARIVH